MKSNKVPTAVLSDKIVDWPDGSMVLKSTMKIELITIAARAINAAARYAAGVSADC